MLKEFIEGYNEAGKTVERLVGDPQPEKSFVSVTEEIITYRLSWLFYFAPESHEVAPARVPYFSKFHAQAHRIPLSISEILASFGDSIVGVFPEPVSPSEDLGYVVFNEEVDAISVAGRLSKSIENSFSSGPEATGYLYAEIELSACAGTLTAPAMTAKKEILLNVGFDCVRRDRDVIEATSEYCS